MDNKMIPQFIYFELLTRCYRFGQCYNILPLQKNRIFMECFHYHDFTTESKKNQLIIELAKNFKLLAGLLNQELIS